MSVHLGQKINKCIPLSGYVSGICLRKTTNNNRVAVLNPVLRASLATMHKLCKCVTWWCIVMSQSHKLKGKTTDEVFEGQCFLQDRRAPVGSDLDFFNHLLYEGNTKTNYVSFNSQSPFMPLHLISKAVLQIRLELIYSFISLFN